jgi:hypothetical protein
MVKHIVLFKLTGAGDEKEKEDQLNEMEKIFGVLPEQLNYISEYRIGRNFSVADHAWDIAIDSLFESRDDLNRYQISAEHKEAIKKASHIKKIKTVVDYEFQK